MKSHIKEDNYLTFLTHQRQIYYQPARYSNIFDLSDHLNQYIENDYPCSRYYQQSPTICYPFFRPRMIQPRRLMFEDIIDLLLVSADKVTCLEPYEAPITMSRIQPAVTDKHVSHGKRRRTRRARTSGEPHQDEDANDQVAVVREAVESIKMHDSRSKSPVPEDEETATCTDEQDSVKPKESESMLDSLRARVVDSVVEPLPPTLVEPDQAGIRESAKPKKVESMIEALQSQRNDFIFD